MSKLVLAILFVLAIFRLSDLYDLHKQRQKHDPYRNFTAEEANEWLQYYENKPKKNMVWKRVREPVQHGGSIDDGYELVEEGK